MLPIGCVQGVRLAYYNFEADVLLLSMTNVIPDHFAVYELGFDASSDAVPKRAVGIHHPGGVPTAISTVEPGCVHHEGLNAFERLVPGISPMHTGPTDFDRPDSDMDEDVHTAHAEQSSGMHILHVPAVVVQRSFSDFSVCVQGHQYSLPSAKLPCKQRTAHREDALPGLLARWPSY